MSEISFQNSVLSDVRYASCSVTLIYSNYFTLECKFSFKRFFDVSIVCAPQGVEV